MSTKRWLPILTFILFAGILLQSWLLVTLSAAIFVIIGLASFWRKRALVNVFYRRYFHYTRSFPGETVPVSLEIENKKILPLSWLRIQDFWPRATAPQDEETLTLSHVIDRGYLTHNFSLRWFERTRRNYDLLFRKRGQYLVGPARIESGDIFGIYSTSDQIGSDQRLTVFPELVTLEDFAIPPEDPFGDLRSRRRLFEDPNRPMGVREHHPEDGFRRIHWPATARTGQLKVRVFQPTSTRVAVLCLNVATYARHWEGVYPELLEYMIRVTATLANDGIQDGYKVGLITNGCLAGSDQSFRIQPGRSNNQLAILLEALAGVNYPPSMAFERYLLREVPRVPFGSTLVIVTAVVTQELSETLLKLKKHERQITLISLAQETPPSLPGIQCFHVPFDEGAASGETKQMNKQGEMRQ